MLNQLQPISDSEQIDALERAITLACQAHAGQRDKAGMPYILHLLSVMHRVSGLVAQQAAVLHDIIEDTNTTAEDLVAHGITPEAIDAVQLLTRTAGTMYSEYVIRLKPNPIARSVKLADLEDNYSIGRVAYRKGHQREDAARIQRYILTHQFLTDAINEAEYRSRIAEFDEVQR